jgi:SH3 domain protein
MKTVCSLAFIGLLFALISVSVVNAETRYVGDTLVITVRELPDDTSTSIKNILTDTPFEALEESGDYLKVRLEDGTEGYVKTRYTTTDTPKPILIERLTRQNEKLKNQYAELTSTLSEKESDLADKRKALQAELENLKQELAEKSLENSKLATELTRVEKQYSDLKTSADNVVQIISQSENFRDENERLQIELETLQSENALLLRTAVIKWVLAGAGILFLGWIMGKVSRTKRRYGGA